MARFNPPSYRIPLGFVTFNNQRFDVVPDKVFFDYLNDVFERIGGESGLSPDEILALVASESAIQRRPANNPLPEATPIQRSNTGEVQALRDRVQSLESQLSSARSQHQAISRAIEDLRAEMCRMPSLEALTRRISDLEAVTL
jgi:hypothetical protein